MERIDELKKLMREVLPDSADNLIGMLDQSDPDKVFSNIVLQEAIVDWNSEEMRKVLKEGERISSDNQTYYLYKNKIYLVAEGEIAPSASGNFRITLSKQRDKPYIVIDDMSEGGITIFAGTIDRIQIDKLSNK